MKCIYKKATPNFKIFKKRARAFIERNKSEELSICEEPNQDYSNALNTISMLKNDQSYELDISAFLNDLLILVYYPADYNIFEIIDESVCKEILKILINLHPIDQVELIQRVCNVITVLNTIPDSRYVQYFSDNGAINIIISKYRENTSQLFLITTEVMSSLIIGNILQNIAIILDNFLPSVENYSLKLSDPVAQESSLNFIYLCIIDIPNLHDNYIFRIYEVLLLLLKEDLNNTLKALTLWCVYALFSSYKYKFNDLIEIIESITKIFCFCSSDSNPQFENEIDDPLFVCILCFTIFFDPQNPSLNHLIENFPYTDLFLLMSNPHKYRQWCSLYLFSRIIKTLDVEFILKLIYEDNLLVSLNDGINGSYISKTYAHKCTLRLLQTNSPEIISDVLRSDLFSSAVDFLVENPPNGVENLLETLRYSLQALQNTPELLKMTVEHLHEIGFVELYQGLKEDQPEDIINFLDSILFFDIKSC